MRAHPAGPKASLAPGPCHSKGGRGGEGHTTYPESLCQAKHLHERSKGLTECSCLPEALLIAPWRQKVRGWKERSPSGRSGQTSLPGDGTVEKADGHGDT